MSKTKASPKSKRGIWLLIKETFKEWMDKDPFRQSATVAYYAIFSLPALLVIVISIASLVFGHDEVNHQITKDISSVMGENTGKQIEEIIKNSTTEKKSIWAAIIGFITVIFGSIGVFEQLQKSLNDIWEVKPKPKQAFLKSLRDKLFSFGLVVAIGFLLLISLVISSILAAFSDWISAQFPDIVMVLVTLIDFTVSFSVITLLFALMFKVLPDAQIRWRSVWMGAMVTAFLFIVGKFALGFYFGKAEPATAYGAAGSIVLVLLWVSYTSMIVFLGAEFTKQYAELYGEGIRPSGNAEAMKNHS